MLTWAPVVLVLLVFIVVPIVGGAILILNTYRRKARQGGYSSLIEYLRAVPSSEEEKRDSVDLALKGVVLCVFGLLFPPFLIIGLIPFYYGARKVAYSSLGLGLFEDAESPSA